MGEFNDKISAEFTPPKTWVLNRGLSFITDELIESEIKCLKEVGANIIASGKITCRKGMKTDLASTPKILWNVIAPWDVARAAIIHDHLYASLRAYYAKYIEPKAAKSGSTELDYIDNKLNDVEPKIHCHAMGRAISDKVFLLAMKSAEPEVPQWKIYSAYNAVRLFGGRAASTGGI
ncbi:uncharacterized protein METZ01_LOCUS138788 [marine metagenome]|uniref:Uncharacterized protein n=1 Tax=marine metagenome TaxID=408172 RepID=A0A381Z9W8_9ZZZZ